MFENLKRLWEEGKLTEIHLNNAVIKSWITPQQRDEITKKNTEDFV
ncbi:XkdX family protein [Paenibacillus pinihumi]|nr:XkdX family protein [Paenibacillus pinihumi]